MATIIRFFCSLIDKISLIIAPAEKTEQQRNQELPQYSHAIQGKTQEKKLSKRAKHN
jgi:hypothetical protein